MSAAAAPLETLTGYTVQYDIESSHSHCHTYLVQGAYTGSFLYHAFSCIAPPNRVPFGQELPAHQGRSGPARSRDKKRFPEAQPGNLKRIHSSSFKQLKKAYLGQ